MPTPIEPGAYWWRDVRGEWTFAWEAVNVTLSTSVPIKGWNEASSASYEATGDLDAFDHDGWWPETLSVWFGEFCHAEIGRASCRERV